MSKEFAFSIKSICFDEDYRPADNTRITTNFANLARGESRQENLRNTLRMIDNRFNALAHWDNPKGDRYGVELEIISVELSIDGESSGNALPLIEILKTNIVDVYKRQQKFRLSEKLVARYGEDLSGRKFALWGLSFKPNTDDMREAPSLTVIAELTRRGASVRAYDPVAMHEAGRVLAGQPGVSFATDMYDALDGADALLIATEWKVFRAPDFDRVKALLKTPLIVDGRNLYTPADVRAQGFEYSGIGRA